MHICFGLTKRERRNTVSSERPIIRGYNTCYGSITLKAQEWAAQVGGIVHPHEVPYRVDGEVGRFTFTTHGVQQGSTLSHQTSRWWFPALQAREWYRTRGFKELALVHGVVEGSYRKTTALINRVRHQSEEDGTPSRTLCDTTEGEGAHILVRPENRIYGIFESRLTDTHLIAQVAI